MSDSPMLPDDYDDMTVPDVKDHIADVESVDALTALREHEASTKARTTAVEAIDARLETLEASAPDDAGDDTLAALADAADGLTGPDAVDALQADTEYVRVRNGLRSEVRLQHIGSLPPGEAKVVQKTATVESHIRNGRIQVVSSDARDTASLSGTEAGDLQ